MHTFAISADALFTWNRDTLHTFVLSCFCFFFFLTSLHHGRQGCWKNTAVFSVNQSPRPVRLQTHAWLTVLHIYSGITIANIDRNDDFTERGNMWAAARPLVLICSSDRLVKPQNWGNVTSIIIYRCSSGNDWAALDSHQGAVVRKI